MLNTLKMIIKSEFKNEFQILQIDSKYDRVAFFFKPIKIFAEVNYELSTTTLDYILL